MPVKRPAWLALLAALASFPGAVPAQQTQTGEPAEEQRVVTEDGQTLDTLLDDQGRVIAERHSDGTVVQYWYDPDGVRHEVPVEDAD